MVFAVSNWVFVILILGNTTFPLYVQCNIIDFNCTGVYSIIICFLLPIAWKTTSKK